jgi:hypothetical protein
MIRRKFVKMSMVIWEAVPNFTNVGASSASDEEVPN